MGKSIPTAKCRGSAVKNKASPAGSNSAKVSGREVSVRLDIIRSITDLTSLRPKGSPYGLDADSLDYHKHRDRDRTGCTPPG